MQSAFELPSRAGHANNLKLNPAVIFSVSLIENYEQGTEEKTTSDDN